MEVRCYAYAVTILSNAIRCCSMITFLNVLTMYGSLVDDSMLISIEEAGTDVEDSGYKAYSVQTDCSDNKRCIIQELKLRESPCRSSSY